MDDISQVLEYLFGESRHFYCSVRTSWKLAKAVDWLHGAITEAFTRPDVRIFYMLKAYYDLVSLLAMCHRDLAEAIKGKTPYAVYRDPEVQRIIEEIMG